MSPEQIKALLARPTITPDELCASGILPLSRNGIYDAIRRGEIEVLNVGRKKAVITASLRRKLGMES